MKKQHQAFIRDRKRRQKTKQGHWYLINFLLEGQAIDEDKFGEVRIFAKSAREAIFILQQDVPHAFVYEVGRLSSKHDSYEPLLVSF